MRSALIEQIARKSLRLSPRSRIEYTNGRQITAISADASYAEWCFPIIVQGIVAPITIVVAFILLLLNLGPSALVVGSARRDCDDESLILVFSRVSECWQLAHPQSLS
jgi:hypothetical protein